MDEFHESLKNFVSGWCADQDMKRRIEENIQRANYEIGWLQNEIGKLELQLVHKPSVIRQINQLQHQILELKVKMAFDPTYGAEIEECK
jgi:wobble nucleotide-excising tRNase